MLTHRPGQALLLKGNKMKNRIVQENTEHSHAAKNIMLMKQIEIITDHDEGEYANGIGYLNDHLVAFRAVTKDHPIKVKKITLAESAKWSGLMYKKTVGKGLSFSTHGGVIRWYQDVHAALK
jgi:hypothetical protein